VGVFWALLFLCHQGSLELVQTDGLFGPLALRRLQAAEHEQVQSLPPTGSADLPAVQQLAA
jgi:segregation and condensation protein A